MNWGKWIGVAFVMFAAFIGTLVTVCVRQDINLVSKNYYQDELAYQQQIERMSNAQQLVARPTISMVDQNYLRIDFDDLAQIETGELKLFCPSNPRNDRTFALQSNQEQTVKFAMGDMEKGMYRARMYWRMKGKEFFVEEVIYH